MISIDNSEFVSEITRYIQHCYIGENNDISVCKDGPIFNSEQLKKFPQFGSYIK
ncbi:unnamed protein product [marine sediment metagenome]|uniref:Uncharacterized protein n=1 Tax=marine sediment metagenome TaxID=412755 RepID=X1BNV2_9ZZZZ